MTWKPSINMDGLRGPLPAREYPSRETALALVAALKSNEWDSLRDLERLTGVDNFTYTAGRCFQVYGYPDLDSVAICRRIVERTDEAHRARQSRIASNLRAAKDARAISASGDEQPATTVLSSQDGYGFQRR